MPGFRLSMSDTGVKEKLARLSAVDARDILVATVNDMKSKAERYAPRGDTGQLANSVRASITGDRGTVGYTAEYAPHVEYGHRQNVGRYVPRLGKRLVASYVPGQHFFRHAVNEERKVLKKMVAEAVEEAIR